MDANERLNKVAAILAERGKSRDLPRERSMVKTCDIFAAITGHHISVADGWRFMLALKLARMRTGKYKEDDYDDLIGYAALLAEEKANEVAPIIGCTNCGRSSPQARAACDRWDCDRNFVLNNPQETEK